MSNVSGLVTTTALNKEISKVESKLADSSILVTSAVENKILMLVL